jgi:acetyl-CoA synthetase
MVFTPLFSAFGPEPIRTRMEIGERHRAGHDRVASTRKIASWRDEIPTLKLVLIVGDDRARGLRRARPCDGAASPRFETVATGRKTRADPFHLRHHRQAQRRGACAQRRLYHAYSGRKALDLRRDDLLVHGRSGLGDRHVLRHHLAAGEPA